MSCETCVGESGMDKVIKTLEDPRFPKAIVVFMTNFATEMYKVKETLWTRKESYQIIVGALPDLIAGTIIALEKQK